MSLLDIRFTGTLTALSPISIVPPNSPSVDANDGEGSYLTVARQTIHDPATGKTEHRPVISASTIRGKLRRSASSICFALAGSRPRLTPYLYATIGDVKGSEKEDFYSIADRNARRERNPVVSLFGASVPWDMSRALVEHAVALSTETDAVPGVRGDDFQRNADILELIDPESLDDYLDKRENVKAKKDAEKVVSNLIRELGAAKQAGKAEDVSRIEAALRVAKSEAKSAKSVAGNSTMLPHMHEAVPVGTQFSHRIVLRKVTEAETGLFLRAIQNTFDQDPVFGAKRALGYGMVAAKWTVEVRAGDVPGAKWSSVGSIAAQPYDEGVLDGDLGKFLEAWDAYAASGRMNMLVDGMNDDGKAAPSAPPAKKPAKAAS